LKIENYATRRTSVPVNTKNAKAVLHPGDVVMCPPDVKHWHGAAPDSRFAHLAAGTNPDRPAVVWTEEMLSKEEYGKLPKE